MKQNTQKRCLQEEFVPLFFPLPQWMPQLQSHSHAPLKTGTSRKETVYLSFEKDRTVFPSNNLPYLDSNLTFTIPPQVPQQSKMPKKLKSRPNFLYSPSSERQSAHPLSYGDPLPSSVMMGMLTPVVIDGWRNIPCTGLLSGDDLSIPGGVKPSGEKFRGGENLDLIKSSIHTNSQNAMYTMH